MIQEYKHPLLLNGPCFVHFEFLPYMASFCKALEETGCKAWLTSSYRKTTNVPGAIVSPAKMSNHLIGHAIDCNIIDKNGTLWNSGLLKNPTGEVKEFINKVISKGIRWGGFFTPDKNGKTDPVHFDDGMNIHDPIHWQEIYDDIEKWLLQGEDKN